MPQKNSITEQPTSSYHVRTLVTGEATGAALLLAEPLSFWGGMDVATGQIIDQHHPQVGICLTGHVILMPAGRGSSSSSSVLAEAIYAGTAPAAIVLNEPDVIVALGAMVAQELYDLACPIVVVTDFAGITQGSCLSITATPSSATVQVVDRR